MSRIATVRRDRERADEQRRHDGWFASHVATRATYSAPDGRTIDALTWAKPKTSCYRIDYLARGGSLVVTGDLGDAVYQAYGPADGTPMLDWWGRLTDLHYFASKCQASPEGRGFRSWDRDEAVAHVREHLAQNALDGAAERRHLFRDRDGWNALESRESWQAWLDDNGYEVFGDDWYEWVPSDRNMIDFQCRAHLEGLRRAIAQLAAVQTLNTPEAP